MKKPFLSSFSSPAEPLEKKDRRLNPPIMIASFLISANVFNEDNLSLPKAF